MKYLSSKFEDYINECGKNNLHEKMTPLFESMSNTIQNQNNLIFYGPSGIGKYTQVLNYIKKFSPTNLKFERKMNFNYNNKKQHFFKISDIHIEIDFELLGVNEYSLFFEIFKFS